MSTKPIRRAVFAPRYAMFNPYQRLLAAAIEAQQVKVDYADFGGRFPLLRIGLKLDREHEVLHLHWLDHAYADTRPLLLALKMLRLLGEIALLRLRGLGIYYTAHNLRSHEASLLRLETWMLAAVVTLSNRTFVHSEAAKGRLQHSYRLSRRTEKRVVVAEHGHYEHAVPRPELRAAARTQYDLRPEQQVFLVFGLVRGYKGLSALIASFRAWSAPDAVLLIAGGSRAKDADEIARTTAAAEGDKRIVTMFRPWPDEELPALFAAADACVIAHDWQLTSGSLILAMGFAKPLLLPDRDITDELPSLQGNIVARPDWSAAFERFAQLSPGERQAIAEQNAQRAASLSWQRAAEVIVTAYRGAA